MPFQASTRFGRPLFVLALVTLALNDHVLKGAGLLPGVVTGKLSDVAGLLVAPLVLAWVLRVRSERGFAWAHVAVGVGFALIQIPSIAAWVPGHVWADPTDLLALPALWISWTRFRPEIAGPLPHRAQRAAIGALALLVCTATSQNSPPPRYPYPPAGVIETDVYLRHRGGSEITVGLRQLNEDATLDCEALEIEGEPFGEEQEWTLADGDAVPLWERRGGSRDRDCYAVMLHAQERRWILAWRHGAPALREIAIRLEPQEPVEDEAVRLRGEEPPAAPPGVRIERR